MLRVCNEAAKYFVEGWAFPLAPPLLGKRTQMGSRERSQYRAAARLYGHALVALALLNFSCQLHAQVGRGSARGGNVAPLASLEA